MEIENMSCSATERASENRKGTGGFRLRGSSSTSVTTPSNSKTDTAGSVRKVSSSASANQQLRTKTCCFYLLCCYSCDCCSSTPGKTKNGHGSNKNSKKSNQPAPLQEIRSWGKSFDKLMKSSAGRKCFSDFLRCEYSEENMLFWLACEELKKETDPEVVEEKSRLIFEEYISVMSPKEVSLDSQVREIVNRNMMNPTPHTFDEAQVQIYTLMHRDSYPRFVNSQMFKKLAKLDGVDDNTEVVAPGTDESCGPKEPHG